MGDSGIIVKATFSSNKIAVAKDNGIIMFLKWDSALFQHIRYNFFFYEHNILTQLSRQIDLGREVTYLSLDDTSEFLSFGLWGDSTIYICSTSDGTPYALTTLANGKFVYIYRTQLLQGNNRMT